MKCKCGGTMRRCRLRPARNGGIRCFHCDECGGISAVDADGKRVRGTFGRVSDAGDSVIGHARGGA